jgi:hypothetical protein
MSKFASRKFLFAVAGFVGMYVTPNLSEPTRAKGATAVTIGYVIAEALADAFGGTKPPQ